MLSLGFDPQWTRPQKHQFYPERFCARLLQATADAPNVMFEIFNEGEWDDAVLHLTKVTSERGD